jgi:PAS domain S-box-containing protein
MPHHPARTHPPTAPGHPLLTLVTELACAIDADGWVDLSAGWTASLGWNREELLALAPLGIVHPDDRRATLGALREAADGAPLALQNRCRAADGSYRSVRWDGHAADGTWYAVGREVDAAPRAAELPGVGTWEWLPAEDVVLVSASLAALAGVDLGRGQTLAETMAFVGPVRRDEVLAGLHALLDGPADTFVARFDVAVPNAGMRWMEARAEARRDATGAVVGVHGTVQDVSEEVMAAEEARLRAKLLDEVDVAVVATDAAGVVTHWNRTAARLYGWTEREAKGRPIAELAFAPDDAEAARAMVEAVRDTGAWQGETQARDRAGRCFPVAVRLAVLHSADGEVTGLIGVSADISRRVQAARELSSARDYLSAVTDSMGEGLCAVDMHGRVAYANAAAERMLGWTLEDLRGRQFHEATHFRRPDGSPYPPSECPIVQGRRTGEAVRAEDDMFIRKDGTELPVAYTSSPIEMEDGVQGAVIVFRDITEQKREQERMARELEALRWLTRIRDALEHDRFVLHAQPIVAVASGETVQHELLIRMLGEDGTLVAPGEFLPTAEQYGLIREIDRWVVRQAAGLAGRGHAIELNLSAESLGDPDLFELVERELREAGADPRLVVIEVTETALLRDDAAAGEFLERIAELGCRTALDDFGTGYGGLTYVKRLPVDSLKIDVEFVRDLPRNPASQHVVRAIVHLARDFGYQTVAEGVEDAETLELLHELGVDLAQGYAIARPAPVEIVLAQAPGAAATKTPSRPRRLTS